ncbi:MULTISPECIES: BA14K family protein [unclassified Bradyrhizobium]|uniref:BA14K family protein n=1 Tax=unclassified Bradyrhizobium TaxID=2631580 RepID=UPI002479C014|nr:MULTISPECIES: BA14K family protein [unclassified Bradyrhizobium]WGS23534.1 BA14K family protein [Bradyrhizobium sp. ISRA463]WGS30557.1 BA14K family protein [Bradyrhizobium sp. ISRA464]
MFKSKMLVAAAILATIALAPAFAGDLRDIRLHPIRYGDTSSWYYDNRDDNRDFPTNGFFPGNFAANPIRTSVGAAGVIGSTPRHSAAPYPSQVVFGARGKHHRPGRKT